MMTGNGTIEIQGYSKRVVVIDHPMVQHKLTLLRNKETGPKKFRELIKELAMFEAYEATRHFQLEPVTVTTPICETVAYTLKGRKVAIVPILRAGLGMVEVIMSWYPLLASATSACIATLKPTNQWSITVNYRTTSVPVRC